MLERNEKGKLSLKSLDLEIFIGDLFAKCSTEEEIDWLQEQLQSCVECSAEERLEEL
ncbi:hypothetical protein [Clostridium magnum]|uniref:Zinc-finger domain-containing protein n=1 Tax=Clostridium magnum DSM 2767 TaxID=1121326 RepID=A0A162UVX0_9CLOT|nr:hypothetical protein [Clostridium magnum]KZL94337.1 hypothetical protein CLMAG_13900 [Clostridium magnum DSM 2767]SHJ54426.1 hypothetical protein SAMN02745944_06131 [Clostridium magnum DSM 2767]